MRILLTGATGYVGRRLLPVLLEEGHEVVCMTRDRDRLNLPDELQQQIEVVEADFAVENISVIPDVKADVAYFLIHSLDSKKDFSEMERRIATNFRDYSEKNEFRQVIYLGGISNDSELSEHLSSREKTGQILGEGKYALTTLKASMIVGSGSASFEIMRDIVEKLPVMILPSWTRSKCQPIAIVDVLQALLSVAGNEDFYDRSLDIGGPEVLTYEDLLRQYAEVRKLNRFFIPVPFLSPKISSYWLYFVTSTNYRLAINLVDSLKNEMICKGDNLFDEIGHEPITFKDAVERAFRRIEQNAIISSWKDAFNEETSIGHLKSYVRVPVHGCYKDFRELEIDTDPGQVLDNVWSIGGERGWYYGNFLWRIRGIMDKIAGGVGLRRGRTHPYDIEPGDALDFWRVVVADRKEQRLLLFAEMKLPGEAWLEFRIQKRKDSLFLQQEATFRPKGLWGRMYWYALVPAHHFIFSRMARNIVNYIPKSTTSAEKDRAARIRMRAEESSN